MEGFYEHLKQWYVVAIFYYLLGIYETGGTDDGLENTNRASSSDKFLHVSAKSAAFPQHFYPADL